MNRWGEKRYHSMDYDLKQLYGEKVYKITLNGGMTCPNRDGKLGMVDVFSAVLQAQVTLPGLPPALSPNNLPWEKKT